MATFPEVIDIYALFRRPCLPALHNAGPQICSGVLYVQRTGHGRVCYIEFSMICFSWPGCNHVAYICCITQARPLNGPVCLRLLNGMQPDDSNVVISF